LSLRAVPTKLDPCSQEVYNLGSTDTNGCTHHHQAVALTEVGSCRISRSLLSREEGTRSRDSLGNTVSFMVAPDRGGRPPAGLLPPLRERDSAEIPKARPQA
jgi:hypothetical protein